MKQRAWLGVKLLMVAALLAYVSRRGILDGRALVEILKTPSAFLVYAPFLLLSNLLLNLRWWCINRAFSLETPFWQLVRITMGPSVLVSLVGGWVGGDMAKSFVLGSTRPDRKSAAVAGILLDRWSGIAGVLFAAALAMLFLPQAVRDQMGGGLLILLALILASVPIAFFFTSKFRLLRATRPSAKALIPALGFSLLLPLVNALGYATLAWYLALSLDARTSLSVVPVSSLLTYLTLLPFGIGVEQLTLFEIGRLAGVPNPGDGALLASTVQTYSLFLHVSIALALLAYRPSAAKRPASRDMLAEHANETNRVATPDGLPLLRGDRTNSSRRRP